jgi:heme/copper-type cytochrome/quinol oxidase subunit 2
MTQQFAEVIFWIAAFCCAVAQVAILRAVFVPHARPDSSATMPQSSRAAEILWAVIPAVALAALLAATWRAIH